MYISIYITDSILEFLCANLGSELFTIILGSRMQIPDLHACNHLGLHSQTSAIRGKKPTIDCASIATQPSVAKKPRSIAQAKQLGHPRQRNYDRLRKESSLAICCKEATISRGGKAAHPFTGLLFTEPECVYYLSVMGSLSQMAKVLGIHNQSCVFFCRGWPNCFACTIDCGFIDADG